MEVLILCILLVTGFAKTVKFVDFYELITDTSCLNSQYSRVCVRGYISYGKIDPNLAKNLEMLKNTNIQADVYLSPCFFCDNPEKQADELMSALKGKTYSKLWVVVEGTWGLDQNKNRNFLRSLVTELKAKGANKMGIYTFQPTWDRLFGNTYYEMSNLPLWYVRLNENPEPYDFVPFGGWSKPTAKQYDTDVLECGIAVNYNSYYGDSING